MLKPKQEEVLEDLSKELERVNDLVLHDDGFSGTDMDATVNDYIAYAQAYTGRAVERIARNDGDGYDHRNRREMLIKAAGLLVNAAARADD